MPIDWDGLVLAPLHAAFGDAVSYTTATATFSVPDAVVDRSYCQVGTDDGGVPVTAWQTLAGVRLASFPAGTSPVVGDRLTANGKTWQVVDVQPDGKGHATLVLGVIA